MAMESSEIERLIKAGIPDARIDLTDLVGDKDHWAATVTSSAFVGTLDAKVGLSLATLLRTRPTSRDLLRTRVELRGQLERIPLAVVAQLVGVDGPVRGVASARVGTVIQLDQTSDPNGYRSNFGFTEVAGASATVQVTAKRGDTGATLGTKSYSLAASSSLQASVSDILGSTATASNLYLQFAVTSGSGRVIAYGATVDNRSGDTIFMAAQ